MSESKPARRWRSIWKWALAGGFAVSVLINLALAVKITVFDSNYPFRPLCFGDPHLGIIALHQPMNERFRDRMQLALWNSRLSRDRILYISYWEWWKEKEILWNASRSIAVELYEQEMGIKRMSDEMRDKLQTARCKFIRKYALANPKPE